MGGYILEVGWVDIFRGWVGRYILEGGWIYFRV